MADITQFPTNLNINQWQRPDTPNPRLASPISATDTIINVTAAFKDKTGAVVTGDFLMGVKNASGYTETIYVPPNGASVDGLVLTGVVRGIRLGGIDFTTGDSSLAAAFDQDSPVYANISAVIFQMMIAAMTGGVASGGANWRIGREFLENINVFAENGTATPPFFRWDSDTLQWVFSNDGVSSSPFGTGAGVTGGDGINVTAGDIDIDLSDTTVFVDTSSGEPDIGKVPRLVAPSGKLDPSVIDTSGLELDKLVTSGVSNEVITNQDALAFVGNARIARADADALDTTFLFAGIAKEAAASAGLNFDLVPYGPIVDIPTLSPNSGRLWNGQTQGVSNTTTDQVFGVNWRGQTFIPATGETNVGAVVLNLTQNGVPTGTYSCQIYNTIAGLPTGAALGTATLTVANMATGNNTFVFASPITVVAGTQYAIVLSNATALINNNYSWNFQNTDVYASGTRLTSANSGVLWVIDASADFRFTVQYRSVVGEPVFLSNTTGELSLLPGTFDMKVGEAVSPTKLMLNPGLKTVFATFSYTTAAAQVVDTEITIGIRPLFVFASIEQPGTSLGSMGMFMNGGASFSLENKGTAPDVNGNTTSKGNRSSNLLQYDNRQLATNANTMTHVLTVQATSANTITIRRTITITGAPGAISPTVRLHIIGY